MDFLCISYKDGRGNVSLHSFTDEANKERQLEELKATLRNNIKVNAPLMKRSEYFRLKVKSDTTILKSLFICTYRQYQIIQIIEKINKIKDLGGQR